MNKMTGDGCPFDRVEIRPVLAPVAVHNSRAESGFLLSPPGSLRSVRAFEDEVMIDGAAREPRAGHIAPAHAEGGTPTLLRRASSCEVIDNANRHVEGR